MKKLALYIHWPFCVSKCPYCDFASRPLPKGLEEGAFVAAYETEMAFYAARTGPRTLGSIYFGGGTPSLMAPESVARLIEKAAALWPLAPDCEITLEANPSSAEREKFQAFRAAGVNRLSLGAQSFDDEALRFLGRAHDAAQARRAIDAAREIFTRFSFDLIYARAGQTLQAWEEEVKEALSFAPKHLSLYQLTIEPGTVFFKRAKKETLQTSDAVAAALYERTQEILEKANLPAYEISNHAAPGQESRHNLTYWRYEEYVGIGPAAHGRFIDEAGVRLATANVSQPARWFLFVKEAGRGSESVEEIDTETAMKEALIMGLRLAAGIDLEAWGEKFGIGAIPFFGTEKVRSFTQEGFLTRTEKTFAATKAGRQRLNALLAELLNGETS